MSKEPSLVSDTYRILSLLLVVLGAIGTLTGIILGFQTPPSPLSIPILGGGVVALVLGTIMTVLILTGFVPEFLTK